MVSGLCAEFAVLRTTAAAAVDDAAQIHLVSHHRRPDGIRSPAQLLQVAGQKEGKLVFPGQPAPLDDLPGQCFAVHGCFSSADFFRPGSPSDRRPVNFQDCKPFSKKGTHMIADLPVSVNPVYFAVDKLQEVVLRAEQKDESRRNPRFQGPDTPSATGYPHIP